MKQEVKNALTVTQEIIATHLHCLQAQRDRRKAGLAVD